MLFGVESVYEDVFEFVNAFHMILEDSGVGLASLYGSMYEYLLDYSFELK